MKTKLLVLLFLASLNTYAQTNLVPNGGFETWTNSTTLSNWTTANNVIQNTSSYTEGSKSVQLSIVSTALSPKITAQVPMTAGTTYTVKFKYKYVNSNYSGQHPISLNISQNGSATTLSSSTFATDNNWTIKETSFTPDQNMSYDLDISLYTFDSEAFDVLIDDVQVYIQGTEQYTLIPDVNFENKLIALGIDSGVADGKVLTSSISSLTSLNVSSSSIVDLTGIQDFVGLTYLNCGRNQLTNLDVTKNTALTDLYCFYNQITSIDISQNSKLVSFMCHFNDLTAIDVSNNPKLEIFDCLNNQITSLDISKNSLITELACENNQLTDLNLKNGANTILDLTYSNFVNNPNLKCIQVDDVSYSNTNWLAKKDATATFNTDCTPYTLIPDVNFENKLIALGIDSGVADGKVLTSAVSSLTSLSVSSSYITDLTGIQDFVSLKTLVVARNNLTLLDLSKNTDLEDLSCFSNQLTALDVSKNTKLVTISCSSNNIKSLDFSTNIALDYISCEKNQLSTLNVSKNTALTLLYCDENQLTSLDVSNNILLDYLVCSSNKLTSLNVTKNILLNDLVCSSNQLTSFDISKNTILTRLLINDNNLSALNLKNENNALLTNKVNFKNNTNLKCIEVDDINYADTNWSSKKDAAATFNTDCTPYTLIPDSNFEDKLIALEIDKDGKNGKVATSSVNTVTYLDVSSSNIVDMTGIQDFIALTYLDCNINNIKTIDVSNNKLLTKLALYDNQLTNLDVTKNTQLVNLEFSNNQISSINLSQNPKLLYLSIGNNQLSNLDISVNIDLQSLYCHNNNLTSLDISKQTSLLTLDCGFNNITSLDLSTNTKLEGLYCYNMQLTALELTNNVLLKTLNAIANQLTTLDLSKNKNLNVIYVILNPLTELNVQNGNNKNFVLPPATGKTTATNIYCSFANNNKLGCIKVDDEAYSNSNWSKIKDASATYSSTCSKLGIEDSVFDKIAIYPNPAKKELHIDNIVLEKATVYDALGKLVKTTTFTSGANNNTMHLEGFPSGIYYIFLESEGANTAKKIIVE